MVPELGHGLLEALVQEGVAGQAVGRHGAVEQPQLLVEDLHLGTHKVPAQPAAWTRFWVRLLRSDLVLLQQLDLDAQVLADLLVALLLVLELPLGPLQLGQRARVPRPQVQLLQVHPVGVVLHPAGDGLKPR